MLLNVLTVALILASLVVGALLWRLFQIRRRHDTLSQIMDSADALERELHACRERMQTMHSWVSTLPSTLTTQALASLNLDPLVQKALRDLLRQRLWIRDQGEVAPMAQLRQTRADMERSRSTLAAHMHKLEAAGEELKLASSESHPVSALIAGAYGIGVADSREPTLH
jgi:chaperonin cofactor prefoldin